MDIELIGYVATVFGATQLVPELFKALRTHHLRDVSWGMLALMLAGSILWLAYGILKTIMPLSISAGMNLIFGSVLTLLKMHYSKAMRPMMRPAMESEPLKENK